MLGKIKLKFQSQGELNPLPHGRMLNALTTSAIAQQ